MSVDPMVSQSYRKCIAFRAHQEGEDSPVRTEVWMGRDFLVVPVVALVEGVLQGMNADAPELALAEEFAAVPQGWDGRPVVMNHPVINNIPVSANSPEILSNYAFGQLFNTRIEDNKLKTEAWLDLERINALGGEIADTLVRVQNGEMIEVSTGLFTRIEKTEGIYNGKQYSGVWRSVVPDHLAFLSEGVLGACSNADGCGAPRVNCSGCTNSAPKKTGWIEMTEQVNINTDGCPCQNKKSTDPKVQQLDPNAQAQPQVQGMFDPVRLMANMVPDGLMDNDVRKLLEKALRDQSSNYIWVMGFTQSKVIYETYGDPWSSYTILQQSYSIDDARVVTLQNDAEPVVLLTEIVPAKALKGDSTTLITNQTTETSMTDQSTNTNTTQTNASAGAPSEATQSSHTATATTVSSGGNAENPAISANASSAAPTVPAPAPRTLEQYLQEAPAGVREVLESGMRMHTARKESCIKALRDTGRCKFTDEQLRGMSLDHLEQMVELAAVPTFEGRALPVRDNSANNVEAPRPILAFPMKSSA